MIKLDWIDGFPGPSIYYDELSVRLPDTAAGPPEDLRLRIIDWYKKHGIEVLLIDDWRGYSDHPVARIYFATEKDLTAARTLKE